MMRGAAPTCSTLLANAFINTIVIIVDVVLFIVVIVIEVVVIIVIMTMTAPANHHILSPQVERV